MTIIINVFFVMIMFMINIINVLPIVIMIMIMIIISLTRCGPWMKMGLSSWSLQILLWGAPSMQAALTGNTFETVEIFLNKYSFNKMAKQGHENI